MPQKGMIEAMTEIAASAGNVKQARFAHFGEEGTVPNLPVAQNGQDEQMSTQRKQVGPRPTCSRFVLNVTANADISSTKRPRPEAGALKFKRNRALLSQCIRRQRVTIVVSPELHHCPLVDRVGNDATAAISKQAW